MAQPISILFLLQIIIVTVTLPVVFIDSFIISTKKIKLMLPSSNNIIHKTSSTSSSVLRLGLAEEDRDTTDTDDEIGKGIIDYQSNTNQFGRGEQHLSAVLYEGDTVIYRTGNWYVDGVLVGGDADAEIVYKICRIETIQIVWTHNCEHGVLRGLDINTTTSSSSTSRIENENEKDLEVISSTSSSSSSTESTTSATSSASASSDDTNKGLRFIIPTPFVDVEFGPEQLVGRINTIEWINTKTTTTSSDINGNSSGNNDDYSNNEEEKEEEGFSSIPLHENMWVGKDEML